MTRSRPCILPLIYSVLDAVLYAVIDSVLFHARSPRVNRVLGAGVEPAHLAALEPKSSVSAIPPPEQNLSDEVCASGDGGKRLHEATEGRTDLSIHFHRGFAGMDEVVL